MNALYQLNPQAFLRGDPARMRALVPLRAPSADEVAAAPRRLRAPAPLADEAPAAIAHSARAAPAHPGLQGTASEATPAPGNPVTAFRKRNDYGRAIYGRTAVVIETVEITESE